MSRSGETVSVRRLKLGFRILWNMKYALAIRTSPWRIGVIVAFTAIAIAFSSVSENINEVRPEVGWDSIWLPLWGLLVGTFVATVDLQPARLHRLLFVAQITFVTSLIVVPLGISSGLLSTTTVAAAVAEGPMSGAARGASAHAFSRVINRLGFSLAGERLVFSDLPAMSFVNAALTLDTFYREIPFGAFADDRIEMAARLAARYHVADPYSERRLSEMRGEGIPENATEALGRALFLHRRGDTAGARAWIKRANTLPRNAEQFANIRVPQWTERRRLFMAVLLKAYPELAGSISSATELERP